MKKNIFQNYFFFLKTNFILTISFIYYCNNYLVLPFKIKKPLIKIKNNINISSEYINYNKNNQIAATIYIGTPPKEIEIYLTMQHYDFFMGKGFCLNNSNSEYDPSLSSSYEKSLNTFFSAFYSKGNLSHDNFIFYENLNCSQNKTINDIEFIYAQPSTYFFDLIDPELSCGYLGLQLSSGSDYFEWYSLIYDLKSKRNIESKKWSIIFNENSNKLNNYDGILVLGIIEDDYKEIFNINNNDYISDYSLPYILQNVDWEIKFNEIYYHHNNKNISFFNETQGLFLIDYNYIICNIDYFDSIKKNFFNDYINKGICFIDKIHNIKRKRLSNIQLLNIIICDKKKFKDIYKFPSLYFKHIKFNKIFELNYKDLFQEIGNSIIFSILLDEEEKYHWTFGRIFLKKYQFIFDNDQKTITYINKTLINDDKKDIKNNDSGILILKIMIIIFLIIGFILGLFFGKKLWDKNRKKRANELDDDYDYVDRNKEQKDAKEKGLFEEKE